MSSRRSPQGTWSSSPRYELHLERADAVDKHFNCEYRMNAPPSSRPSPHRSPSRAALPELKPRSTMVRGGGNCKGTRTHIEPRRTAGSHPAGRRTRFSPLSAPLLFRRAKIASPIRLRRIAVGGRRLCSKWEKQRRYMDGL